MSSMASSGEAFQKSAGIFLGSAGACKLKMRLDNRNERRGGARLAPGCGDASDESSRDVVGARRWNARKAETELPVAGVINVEGLTVNERDRVGERPLQHAGRADPRTQPAPEVQAAFGRCPLEQSVGAMPKERRRHAVAALTMFAAQSAQMLVEGPIVEELLDDELHEILHVRIGTLLDLRELVDDRLSGDQPTQSQTRRQHFRETIQIDDDRLRVKRVGGGRGGRMKEKRPLSVVFDDRNPVAGRQCQELASQLGGHRPPGGIVEGGIGINELWPVPDELFFELVRIVAQDIPPDEPRARRTERGNGTERPRPIAEG